MPNFPELSERETLVLKNVLRVLISEGIFSLPLVMLVDAPREFGVPAVFLRPTVDQLCEKKLLVFTQPSAGSCYSISPEHIDELYDWGKELNYFGTALPTSSDHVRELDQQIPASDRFVSLTDNSDDVEDIKTQLDNIEKRVETSNELTADKEQRLAIIREVHGVRELLEQPIVRAASIWQAARGSGILNWLAQHGSDAVLNGLASVVISHLLRIVGLSP